jgi:glycosidase
MPASLFGDDFQLVLNQTRDLGTGTPPLTPSPEDWRDQWIYFLMIDRFNNRLRAPAHAPFDDPGFVGFQGGTFRGVKDQLPYLKELGAGAIWLSPALRNLDFEKGTYHGYGIYDFLRAEPRFAEDPVHADEELRDLVDAAHANGLFVIFDIVLNHIGNAFLYQCDAGDGLCNTTGGAEASFHGTAQNVLWRDPSGVAADGTTPIESIASPSRDAFVWPRELQRNEFFRRQGVPGAGGDDTVGDFSSLKQLRTDNQDLQAFLIRAYQYVIARFDVDGFRIDTLKYLKNDLARIFGNSMREFALSAGKKNFFTFGEVFDNDEKIASFIGRSTRDSSDLVGVDAALDFPLRFTLPSVVKSFSPPNSVSGMYQHRKDVEQNILSSHGDATRFFVTFLDNHDVKERIRFVDSGDQHKFDDQVTLGLACLFALQGIPCVYYGTEQGLHGRGTDEAVREALWGGPGFNRSSPFYQAIQSIATVRRTNPALRYGRQYFRPVSGDGQHYGVSPFSGGILAFSRILNDLEIIVAANTSGTSRTAVDVIVERQLSHAGDAYTVLYSNQTAPTAPNPVVERAAGAVEVQEVDGSFGTGPLHTIRVTLGPMEVQILGR